MSTFCPTTNNTAGSEESVAVAVVPLLVRLVTGSDVVSTPVATTS